MKIDCTGLACPQPVIRTKRAIEAKELPLTVLVDNEAAKQNVTRMGQKLGCAVHAESKPDGVFALTMSREEEGTAPGTATQPDSSQTGTAASVDSATAASADSAQASSAPTQTTAVGNSSVESAIANKKAVVYLSAATMGVGDDELGSILVRGFLKTLLELSPPPEKLICVNGAVKLAVDGASKTVPSLRALAEKGCDILACGTCLDFFGLQDQLAVGRVTNMFEIVETLNEAQQVIKP